MNVNGAAGGIPYTTGVMSGVGTKMLREANQAPAELAQRMLPMQVAENAGRAASEAKGLFVDTYA